MPISTGTTSACDSNPCQNFPVLWDNYPAYSSGQVVAEFVVSWGKHERGLRLTREACCWSHLQATQTPSTFDSKTETGWTVGAGVEIAFAPNWTVKADLFVDLPDAT